MVKYSQMLRVFVIVAVLLAGGTGCRTHVPATPYQPRHDASGGYSEYRIGYDMFAITFVGDVELDIRRLEKHLLRRAAEVTLEYQFRYFKILRPFQNPRPSIYSTHDPLAPAVHFQHTIFITCFMEKSPGMNDLVHARRYLASQIDLDELLQLEE
jgi:hypothetical protein